MRPELFVTGMGVISAIGQGKANFVDALLRGARQFGKMQRPGRGSEFCGAEIRNPQFPQALGAQVLRNASFAAQLALVVLEEAWTEAGLSQVDPHRIGLVIGGCNVQQRELDQVRERYRERPEFLRPSYGLSFMDSDLCGFCTEHFGIRGPAYTAGAASASGQLAIIQAAQAVLSGQVDVCIALGALMDLSHWECRAMRALGAMGSDRFASDPMLACRPFDRDRDGFIYGECSGAIVIESAQTYRHRTGLPYAVLTGWGMTQDGNRNPDPSLDGEIRAIQTALHGASWAASQIDYINPHATGSMIGDLTELQAIRDCELDHAYLNTTKSLIGHGLTAAGVVEVIATLLQMRAERLHPSCNLDCPIDAALRWVRHVPIGDRIDKALTLSMGFGGTNTALCWQRYESTM